MKTVLVVDDGAFMRQMIAKILNKNSFCVIGEAEDGVDAIEKYMQLKPDLVTLDITMPKMDGIEVLRVLMDMHSDANVIMISSLGQEQYIREAIMLGAKSFLVKPFDEDTLMSTIEMCFE